MGNSAMRWVVGCLPMDVCGCVCSRVQEPAYGLASFIILIRGVCVLYGALLTVNDDEAMTYSNAACLLSAFSNCCD